jgi:acyl-coenzyme A synthetase/AMP-(fatty) acid ligase
MPSKLWSKLTRKESKDVLALKVAIARQLLVLAELKLHGIESINLIPKKTVQAMAHYLVVVAELESRGIESINLIPKKVDRDLVQEARRLESNNPLLREKIIPILVKEAHSLENEITSLTDKLMNSESELELLALGLISTTDVARATKVAKATQSNSGPTNTSVKIASASRPKVRMQKELLPELEEINTPKVVESPEIFLDHAKFQALLNEAENKKLVTKILGAEEIQPIVELPLDTQIDIIKAQEPVIIAPHAHTITIKVEHSADTQIEIIKVQEPAVAAPHVSIISVPEAFNELKALNPLKTLNYFAKATPQAIAIVNEKRSITYEQLNILVRQFALKFRKIGIQPGDFVVTQLSNTLDWISTLALMSQGVITCSKSGRVAIDPALGAKFLISDGTLIWNSNNTIILDDAWIADAENSDVGLLSEDDLDLHSTCRVIITNRTLGKPRAVGISLKLLNARVDQYNRTWLKEQSIMPLMELSTSLGFFTFYSLFVRGEKIITSTQFNFDAVRLALAHDVEILIASTLRVVQLLEVLKRTESTMPALRKVVISGNLPTFKQLTNVADTLGVEVLNIYGSIECGDISFSPVNSRSRPSDLGWIYPEAKVQIVDVAGEKVAKGIEGRIATSSSTMVNEYFRTLEPNLNAFDQGWFYSGDTGYLTEDGRLVITGRDADLINFGKMKISPFAIEELVLDYAGILDCGAFSFLGETNEQRLAVAIVGDNDLNLKLMTTAITRELGEMAPQTYFVTDVIPRDALGKIQRDKLEQSLHEKIAHQTHEHSEQK